MYVVAANLGRNKSGRCAAHLLPFATKKALHCPSQEGGDFMCRCYDGTSIIYPPEYQP